MVPDTMANRPLKREGPRVPTNERRRSHALDKFQSTIHDD